MRWVNELAAKLYKIMKSADPVEGINRIVDKMTHEITRGALRYMDTVNKMEQKYNTNGGI